MNASIEQAIRDITVGIVNDLAAGRLERIPLEGERPEDFAAAFHYYRQIYPIVPFPPEGLAHIDIIQPRGETDLWRVELPLWTSDGGPSDLWLYLTFRRKDGELNGTVYTIHVP